MVEIIMPRESSRHTDIRGTLINHVNGIRNAIS
jgi:hypothetical protein